MRRRGWKSWWIGAVLGLVAVGFACSDVSGPYEELGERREAWEALGLDDYDYTLRVVCFCPGEVTTPVRVAVRGDTVADLTYVQSGEPVDSLYRSLFLDVDGLFDKIRGALDQDADSLDARYHATLHFPTHVWIDYSRLMADEEIGYEASELAAVQVARRSR
ncbi:MAG: DUF6174 domain-containing protein [Gemmatimonadales bacterium]